ncbi:MULTISPECIES: FdtA/QdtA family cupin domain-containing protein [unclassified Pseudomonas]|jgi:dTDP-4-dehydrorhamnose 3,5-epimerase-like enzyme|uniref:dTDP-6-deoxy-3,4-keto-hexulose isomerase n=1 Tax=Pseudomonas gorinensis TaxID=3240790 RepID=A0ACA7P3N1_9PSED|nr:MULTISPECIES: FdtA/QdtA family cupin domain-containing protein [unclassified Pseudomonas]AHC34407.1 dTDP-6-deoxy-3,4-keto-hexulose isomerase [Pseudomonas sp. TKP]MBL1309996.1 WxcM-like domain-containing protein [Pseudomonas sp.]PMX13625.1 WxcM-like domain-containing protein [Pseudomonas sp. MPBC4-3]PMX45735.1 WxcM-like domain-containing protein [Pseudomonas sp. FW301-21B01]PMY06158.1 WxcM-like domain-containing protein [Pseudomonas sp. MPR-R5A]
MSLVDLVDLQVLGDERGQLVVLEAQKNVPFDIKRVYFLMGTRPGVSRGFHAHRELLQAAICVSGQCRMLMNDGLKIEEVILNSSSKAIFIDKMIWHEMHDFSSDCVLLVLASDFYNEQDYIRDYSEFIGLLNRA